MTNLTDETTTVSCDTELAKVSLLDHAVTILDDPFDDRNFVSTEGQNNSLESEIMKKKQNQSPKFRMLLCSIFCRDRKLMRMNV